MVLLSYKKKVYMYFLLFSSVNVYIHTHMCSISLFSLITCLLGICITIIIYILEIQG
jgi:hypothetical protein